MRTVIFILLCCVYSAVFAQQNPVIEHGESYKKSSVKPFLSDLHDQNDYVLSYRATIPDNPDAFDYFILTKKGSTLTAYSYNEPRKQLTKIPVKADSISLLWKAFTDFDIFSIRDEKEAFAFCPAKYDIYNSFTYEIILLSGDRMKKLSYYDPEYYHRVCNGMIERKKVIDCVSLINYIIPSVVIQPYVTSGY